MIIQGYIANTIAKNIYAHVDTDSNEFISLQEIYDHSKVRLAVASDNMCVEKNRKGSKAHNRGATKGGQRLVQWRDRSADWMLLKRSEGIQSN
jgi:hypothetical protein